MKANYEPLGDYIQEINNRDRNLTVDLLLGVSIQKKFIPSIANIIGTDMSTYKIVKRNQFAYGPVTSRNGDKISIALLEDYEEAIVSQAYIPFEVKDTDELLPEYLMMWFRRPEFDRYARFMSHGSAREIFDWSDMCNTLLPIPSITKQKEIVKEYNVIQNRITLNQQLIKKLEETAQTIYKQWFVDFEFPDENGKPYKSSGGEMVESELGEIPKGWNIRRLDSIADVIDSLHLTPIYSLEGYPMIRVTDITSGFLNLSNALKVNERVFKEFTKKYQPKYGDILISRVGTYGICSYTGINNKYCIGQNTAIIVSKKVNSSFIFTAMNNQLIKKQIEEKVTGSTQKTISLDSIRSLIFALPNNLETNEMIKFEQVVSKIICSGSQISNEVTKLVDFKNILLSKLATIEE